MRQFTSEQLQAQFETLPPELQQAVSSPDISDTIQAIGARQGLHVDQIGELVDMVGLVMLGLLPSKKFVGSFSEEAGVPESVAEKIAEDINSEVFVKIRKAMQQIEDAVAKKDLAESNASSLEAAGGFSIERENSPATTAPDTAALDKDAILAHIENPHTEPLIDQLLSGPAGRPEQKKQVTVEHATATPPANLPATPAQPTNPSTTADMYRETV